MLVKAGTAIILIVAHTKETSDSSSNSITVVYRILSLIANSSIVAVAHTCH
jgi:hypothetical protein